MMKSLKVELHHLNDVRKIIAEKQLMNMDYKIKTEKDYGYIPIKETTNETLIQEIKDTLQMPELEIKNTDTELTPTKHYPKSITEALCESFEEYNDVNIKVLDSGKYAFSVSSTGILKSTAGSDTERSNFDFLDIGTSKIENLVGTTANFATANISTDKIDEGLVKKTFKLEHTPCIVYAEDYKFIVEEFGVNEQ